MSSETDTILREISDRLLKLEQKKKNNAEMIEQAKGILEHKNFANTGFLAKKLGISHKKSSIILYALGWTKYGEASNNKTYKRKGFELQ